MKLRGVNCDVGIEFARNTTHGRCSIRRLPSGTSSRSGTSCTPTRSGSPVRRSTRTVRELNSACWGVESRAPW